MCLKRGLFVLYVLVVAEAGRIPVEVRYERFQHNNPQANLEAKQQLKENPAVWRNLEAKPQLLNDQPASLEMFEHYQKSIEEGLDRLIKTSKNSKLISVDSWDKFQEDIQEYFETEKRNFRQQQQQPTQQNVFQNIANGVQQVTTNFLQSVTQQNRPQNGTASDQGTQQGPFQAFIENIQGGVQNVLYTVSNSGTIPNQSGNSTVLGDTPQQPPGIFSGFVSQVQQIFQGSPPQVTNSNNTQSDPGSNSTTGSNSPSNPFQQIVQNFGQIGSQIGQFIQGGSRPQGSEDESSSPSPGGFLQSISQNFGNAIQGIQNTFRPPGIQNGSAIPGQISNVGSQVAQQIGQVVPTNPLAGGTKTDEEEPAGSTTEKGEVMAAIE